MESELTSVIRPLSVPPTLLENLRDLRSRAKHQLEFFEGWPAGLTWPDRVRLFAWRSVCLPLNMIRHCRHAWQGARQYSAICKELARQLAERPRRGNSDVGSPDCDEMTRRVFLTLERMILDQLGWPETQLTWADPMALVGFEPYNDLGGVYLSDDIEDTFGVHFEDEEYPRIFSLSVGGYAFLIALRATKVPLSPSSYKRWEER